MRGLVNNPTGEIIELPVKASFKEGMNVLEYFISTHGARKGLVDTALRTATAGYLTRRLVDVAQDVIVKEEDCKDKEGYMVFVEDGKFMNVGLGKRLIGRTVMEEIKDQDGNTIIKKNKIISKNEAGKIDGSGLKKIKVRSVVTCKSLEGVCAACYGYDLSKNEPVNVGEAVGIVTAQAIGEPGTQMTMRTFHTGGIAGGSDITMGLPRVDEIFEARPPHVKAVICDVDGKVDEIEESTKQKIVKITVSETGESREYAIPPGINPWVEAGDLVHIGQQLSDGHVDLKELFKTTGDIAGVARHIVREVQRVYFTTGEGVNDKHIELIVKQMFSRVRVADPGDTSLLTGDIIEKRKIVEENQKIEEAGKQPATSEQLLLGITKVSLSTESFLSAASFQETAKVLIEAAVAGKSDPLRGLKENVIIGRLIPAGTGLNVKEEEEEEGKKENKE
jgi:DNA-directed RNA polymerase subunit beta'